MSLPLGNYFRKIRDKKEKLKFENLTASYPIAD